MRSRLSSGGGGLLSRFSAHRLRAGVQNRFWASLSDSSSFPRRGIASASASSSHQDSRDGWQRFHRVGLAALASLCVVGGLSSSHTRRAKACGIVGYVGSDEAVGYLLEGMQILLNRGYDSTGIATLHDASSDAGPETILRCSKFASTYSASDSFDLLRAHAPSHHPQDVCGIGHTRWATHGAKTDENAHPHVDYKERVAVVHNGTIENSDELKKELEDRGIPFSSQTDTEVIAQLIGAYLDDGETIMDAINKTLPRLQGTYGLAIVHKDSPGQIIAIRRGSPMTIGIADGRHFVASEHTAYARHTRQYVSLHDGEIAVIKADSLSINTNGRLLSAPEEEIDLDPSPYPFFTIKEILEQPEAIARALKHGARLADDYSVILGGLDSRKKALLQIKHLIIGACGTSLYASLYGARLMRMLESFDSVQCIDSAELEAEAFPRDKPGLLVVSQSGETKDVMRNVELAQSKDIFAFSVINAIGSLIARTTNCGVYVHAGREHAVASTKAFITQVACMALIAGWFAQNRNGNGHVIHPVRASLISALHHLPTYAGMTLQTRPECKKVAESLKDVDHVFVLGKGFGHPIALEGALKIKEITYVHAEGYSGGALKHGPFALIEDGTPIIMLVLDDSNSHLMRTACSEVKARGARVIAITDNPKLCEGGIADTVIKIPQNGPLTALLAVIPLQLIAYELAVLKGIDPDKPKNLAKAVTVD